jgi:signal transduction histidine kinase
MGTVPANLAMGPLPGRTLLVVDADAAHRAHLDELLSRQGFRVAGCESWQTAVDWLRTGRPDLIVLDGKMLASDGAQFRESQKRDPRLSRIPVVALSIDLAAAIDADALLKHPVDAEMLLATIGDLLFAREHRELQARLEQGDRLTSLGTLAAGVAHEINNPLAYLMLNVDHARQKLAEVADPAERARWAEVVLALDRASEGAGRIRGIVDGLRTFSRPERERVAPLRVVDVLEGTLRMLENELRLGARLVTTFEPVPEVVANEGRLAQVFLNLLMNALQALPEGRGEESEIRVAVSASPSGSVVVEIQDNGAGIPESVRGRIFEPFFTTKPVGMGTGLGLAICHGIVTSFGGTLSVTSEPGHGSLFRIELPAAPGAGDAAIVDAAAPAVSPAAREVDPPPAPSARPERRRILIVDDEPWLCTSLARVLAAEGEVVTVTSARLALEHVATGERFDVVLCDLMMPGMDGAALYDELRQVAPSLVKRMVFMTGGAFTSRARSFLERVPNPRVTKPFDVAALRAVVRAVGAEQDGG